MNFVIGFLALLLLGWLVIRGVIKSATEPVDHIPTVQAFLGMPIDVEEILSEYEHRLHPDRPLHITLRLTQASAEQLHQALSSIPTNRKVEIDDEEKYRELELVRYTPQRFFKSYQIAHYQPQGEDYPFHTIELHIDFSNRLLNYKEFRS
jgi:hypothetical protein